MSEQPWLTSQDSVEALELLEEVAASLRNVSTYAAMRKELRNSLEQQSRECEDFVLRARKAMTIDESLLLAIDALAMKRKTSVQGVIQDAIESYISAMNRRA